MSETETQRVAREAREFAAARAAEEAAKRDQK